MCETFSNSGTVACGVVLGSGGGCAVNQLAMKLTVVLSILLSAAARPPFTGEFPWERVPTMCQTGMSGRFVRSGNMTGTGRYGAWCVCMSVVAAFTEWNLPSKTPAPTPITSVCPSISTVSHPHATTDRQHTHTHAHTHTHTHTHAHTHTHTHTLTHTHTSDDKVVRFLAENYDLIVASDTQPTRACWCASSSSLVQYVPRSRTRGHGREIAERIIGTMKGSSPKPC